MGLYRRKTESGSYWWYSLPSVYNENGKRVSASTGMKDRKAAEIFYSNALNEAVKKKSGLVKAKEDRIKLSFLLDSYCNTESKSQKKTFEYDKVTCARFQAFFGDILADGLTPEQIINYRLSRQEIGRSKPTINREITVLKRAFNFGIENRKVKENPCRFIKSWSEDQNKRDRYLTQAEKVGLFNALDTLALKYPQYKETYLRTRRIVQFALKTGCREGEILALRWSEVKLDRATITILDSKAQKQRHISIPQELVEMLKSMPSVSPFVFGTDKDMPKDSQHRKPFHNAVDLAKLNEGITDRRKKAVFHSLRHSYASDLVSSGVDLYVVKELMGHSSVKLTERYAHLAPNKGREAVEVLNDGAYSAICYAPATLTVLGDSGSR